MILHKIEFVPGLHTYIVVPSERPPDVCGDHPGDEEAEEADLEADLHGVVGVHGQSAGEDEDAHRHGHHHHGQGEHAELRRSKQEGTVRSWRDYMPQCSPTAMQFLPNLLQPKQNQTDSGTAKL